MLVSIFVFVAGFVFDIFTLGRIDDLLNLVQQAVYLTLLGSILVLEVRVTHGTYQIPEKFQKYWKYHSLAAHFLFGSLLSAYTIFYYTSASAITSFAYIFLLVGLMLANEIPRFQNLGLPVRIILYNICLMSYFAFFYPIIIGHVGVLPFWLGFLSSLAIIIVIYKKFLKDLPISSDLGKKTALVSLIVHFLFLIGYYFSLIPPVPVAVKKIGIYYKLEKTAEHYEGYHLSPSWKFWEKGSQDFRVRPDDKITLLVSIFSPARFNDKIYLRWYWSDPKAGWTEQDVIPMNILGGRDEGFRGFGVKANYLMGDWKVEVETSDGREVGRIRFSVTQDMSTEERAYNIDKF